MDKGYDSDRIREHLVAHDIVPVIPPKNNRTAQVGYDKDLYKLREQVERFFNRLKQFRRIATRYEKLSQTFLAFIHLVAAWVMIK
jgi:transposase